MKGEAGGWDRQLANRIYLPRSIPLSDSRFYPCTSVIATIVIHLLNVILSRVMLLQAAAEIIFPTSFNDTLLQAVLAGHFGSLSRISFHYPATFIYFDTVMTVCRFLRTKKNIKKYKFKQEEVIARVIEGKSSDRRESNSTDDQPFLSYGTV